MSYYVCAHCGKREDIFGHGGARAASEKMGFVFLGEIPLNVNIRIQSDNGSPVALDENTSYGKAFRDAAQRLVEQVQVVGAQTPQEISIE
jgi:ATP-binding protein involved in chromosome partitioning